MTFIGNCEGYSINESLRESVACVSRPLVDGGVEEVMVKGGGVFAADSMAGAAWPLCADGVWAQWRATARNAPSRCVVARQSHAKPLAYHHNRANEHTGFVPGLRVFVGWHGFLLIIRGFVKVAVCNAGVIQQ